MIAPPAPAGLRPAFAGAAATLSGVGLGRFAYVPLFPAMVAAGWVTGSEAGYLGATNLAGYLAGVLGARPLARRLGTPATLTLGMLLAAASCLGCAWNGGAAWLAGWRGVAGIAGGILMAIAGPAVQGAVAPERRGFAGGIVFTGVGTGVVIAALAVPAMLRAGVAATWLALALVVAVLLALNLRSWPATPVPRLAETRVPGTASLCLAYGLSAAGLVPHMVYFADFVVRGRGFDLAYGSLAWLLFGAGTVAGPLLAGRVADRIGALPAFRIWLLIQVAALGAAFVPALFAIEAAAFLGGFAAVGLSTTALARARELAGPASGGIWVKATAAFAVAQAVGGFGFAVLFARTGSHGALFAAGLVLSVAALLPVLVRRRHPLARPEDPGIRGTTP